ncbi:unnamed protein product [Closterium sp. NIES-53]
MDRVRAMTTGASLSSKFWPYALEYAAWLHNHISCSSNPSAHSPYFMMTGKAADVSMARTFGCLCYYLPSQGSFGKFEQRGQTGMFLGLSNSQKAWIVRDLASDVDTDTHFARFFYDLMLPDAESVLERQRYLEEVSPHIDGWTSGGEGFGSRFDSFPASPPSPTSPTTARGQEIDATQEDSPIDDAAEIGEGATASDLPPAGVSVPEVAESNNMENEASHLYDFAHPPDGIKLAAHDATPRRVHFNPTVTVLGREEQGTDGMTGLDVLFGKQRATQAFNVQQHVLGCAATGIPMVDLTFDSFPASPPSPTSPTTARGQEIDATQEDSPIDDAAEIGEGATASDLPPAGVSVPEVAESNNMENEASHLYDFAYPPDGIELAAHDATPRRVHFNPTVTVLGREEQGTDGMTGLDVLFGKQRATQAFNVQQHVLGCAATGIPMVDLTYKEPKTLKDMTTDPYASLWQAAVDAEFAKFDELEAYEVVDRADVPKGTTVLTKGVVLRMKRNERGQPNRFKARWVVKGCGQTWGTYDGTYAPVSQGPTSRMFVAGASTTKRKNTADVGLVYGGGDLVLRGYTDSDYANEVGCHSVGGYVFTLGGAAVSWRTKHQTVIATSTAEAEYIAMFEGAREATYLRRLCDDLGFPQQEPTVLFVDNQSAISLATGEQMSQRTKHMEVRYHWTQKAVQDGVVWPEYCPTAQQAADYLTKPITAKQHLTYSLLCGLQPIPPGTPPATSRQIDGAGAALTCSSFLRGDGHQGIP